ncbi:MAG: CoA transferase [Deltaproteobacteria bacterium]|nr:CoA transferase [Deltaproteobacteria bacterium]
MAKLPLEGITVIDFATLIAAPVIATFLGDFGATVIKVEQPDVGEPMRHKLAFPDGRSPIWLNEGRNKKTITLNLRTEQGQEIAHKLAEKADVVLLNFRPGQAEKWNIGPEDLHKSNENLIVALVSAYGQTGPYSKKGGFDRTIGAFCGTTYVTGYPDNPPVRTGYAQIDYMTAYMGAFGVMTALYNREVNQTGGEIIDLSLAEAGFRCSEAALMDYSMTGSIRERTGNRNPHFVPAEDFETRDGRILVINAGTERLWKKLACAMGQPELLEDERFDNTINRIVNQNALYAIIANWVKELTAEQGLKICDDAGVPADIIRNIADLADDPHMRKREAVMAFNDPEKGDILIPGVFPKMLRFPGKVKFLGARLGEHNHEIYGGLIGLSNDEISKLKDNGVI